MLKPVSVLSGAVVALILAGASAPAFAQAGVCARLNPLMEERERIMKRINGLGSRNVNPATACSLFGQLAANGARTIAFVRENKDWCQIPDDFQNNLTSSQAQINRVRGQACNAAKQRGQMEAQARRQQQQQSQQGLGPFGGVDTVTGGSWRVPQGAL